MADAPRPIRVQIHVSPPTKALDEALAILLRRLAARGRGPDGGKA